MNFFSSKADFKIFRNAISTDKTIGFVPTMGALHNGHLSLFKQSLSENDITIGTVFVNPTQFDNPEDLEKYPNLIEQDKKLLENIGVDALIFPTTKDMYPNGIELENIDLQGLDQQMEGRFRTGHFDGVATIVKRLLEMVHPHNAYFGEKDFQQLQIIKKMVEVCKLPVLIKGMPIIREESGLAMSSRNLRLTEHEKTEATLIYKTLQTLKAQKKQGKTIKELLQYAHDVFENSNLQLEYCTINNVNTLEEETNFKPTEKYRAFVAAYCGKIRLIDNQEL